jgi:tetratricopeptide (TPR) repeat protein
MGSTLYGRLITHSLSVHNDPSSLKKVIGTTKEPSPSTSSEDQNSTVTTNKLEQVENEFYAPSLNSSQSAILDSLRKTWALRHFDEMLSIINGLPPELSQTKEVTLYKLRALGRSGEELGKILSQQEIQDGEYFFHKARFLAGNKDYQGALESLTKAESLPCEFLDKRILGREVRLYRARCLTGQFRASPSSENLKAALTAWDSLLESVQNNPNSIQGKEAGKEKQNLVAEAQWRGIK